MSPINRAAVVVVTVLLALSLHSPSPTNADGLTLPATPYKPHWYDNVRDCCYTYLDKSFCDKSLENRDYVSLVRTSCETGKNYADKLKVYFSTLIQQTKKDSPILPSLQVCRDYTAQDIKSVFEEGIKLTSQDQNQIDKELYNDYSQTLGNIHLATISCMASLKNTTLVHDATLLKLFNATDNIGSIASSLSFEFV